jgi:glutamine cyclotransferase
VDKKIHVYGYEIVHEFPHDPTAFTQVRWFPP